jgi:hypothetical protein
MDPQVSTSFIPKKALTGERPTRGSAFGFIVLVAILVFVASGAAAGGTFLYGQVLQGSLESKKKSLETSQQAYDPGVIEELVRLDGRINQGKSLLGKHVAPSSVFLLLSEQTLEDVQFTSFEYSLAEEGYAEISMAGKSRDFSTVALQSDQFGANKTLRDVVFSGIAIGTEEGVTFSVDAKIDLPNLLYSKHLNQVLTLPSVSTTTEAAEDGASTSTPAETGTEVEPDL